jgi:hypothetical protein
MPGLPAILAAFTLLLAPQANPLAGMSVRDINGLVRSPLAPAPGDVNLLFFVTVDCPISNRYAPEIAKIVADYGPKGVRGFLIYADPALAVDKVRAHLASFHAGTSLPAIIDKGFALTNVVGANVTPEAAVYTSTGLAYRGRIDDWYVMLGKNRREPTQRDVRVSLDAVLAGRPVPVTRTQAVGCFIEKDR